MGMRINLDQGVAAPSADQASSAGAGFTSAVSKAKLGAVLPNAGSVQYGVWQTTPALPREISSAGEISSVRTNSDGSKDQSTVFLDPSGNQSVLIYEETFDPAQAILPVNPDPSTVTILDIKTHTQYVLSLDQQGNLQETKQAGLNGTPTSIDISNNSSASFDDGLGSFRQDVNGWTVTIPGFKKGNSFAPTMGVQFWGATPTADAVKALGERQDSSLPS